MSHVRHYQTRVTYQGNGVTNSTVRSRTHGGPYEAPAPPGDLRGLFGFIGFLLSLLLIFWPLELTAIPAWARAIIAVFWWSLLVSMVVGLQANVKKLRTPHQAPKKVKNVSSQRAAKTENRAVQRKPKRRPERADHALINAMEKELDIPLSVWDDTDSKLTESAPPPQTAPSEDSDAIITRNPDAGEPVPLGPSKKMKRAEVTSNNDDAQRGAQVSEKALPFRLFTLAELIELRASLAGNPKTLGVWESANHEIMRRSVAGQSIAEDAAAAAKPSTETPDKTVRISDLSDEQLSNLNARFTKKGPSKEFTTQQFHSVLAEILRRATIRHTGDSEAKRAQARQETPSTTTAPFASGQMTIEEAVAQAKAEGFDYDKAVSSDYQNSLKYSPLELRITKRTCDTTAQAMVDKGDYDMAVVFSAHSKGIQQALDEKGGNRHKS